MVAIVILVISIAAVVTGISMRSASGTARGWPVVTGKIVERGVGPATTTGASRAGRYVEPRVTYTYTVERKHFTGHRIALAANAYDEDKARRVANELPESVEVHYNPSDPSDALLQPSAIGMSIFILIVGGLGLLIGAGLLFASFTKK
ncbi:MAG: DUF3592 domain-containing protein [Kofleriaceae bacterium]